MADNLTIFNSALDHNAPDVFDGVNRMMLDLHVASGLRTKAAYAPTTAVTALTDDVVWFEDNFYIPTAVTEFSFTDNDILYTWTWNVDTWDETTFTSVAYTPTPGPITESSDGVTHNGTHFIVPTGLTAFSFKDDGVDWNATFSVDTWSFAEADTTEPTLTLTVKTDNTGTSLDDEFTIPTTGAGYDYTIEKYDSDGTTILETLVNQTGDVTLSWVAAGTYNVKISAKSDGTGFPRIYFNEGGDCQKLLDVNDGGGIAYSSFDGAYDGCANLTDYTGVPNLSNVTSLNKAFNLCSSFNPTSLDWDVSNVQSMNDVFSGCSVFNTDISGWNVGLNCTTMAGMFYNCSLFNQNIGSWNVSNVQSMTSIFRNASAFNADISGWNVGNVSTFIEAFRGASAFNQNIGGWDVSGVFQTSGMNAMFLGASTFNHNLDGWCVTDVTEEPTNFRLSALETWASPIWGTCPET